jgi:hypothetical protein
METEKLDTFLGRATEFAAILYVGGFGRKFCLIISSVQCAEILTICKQCST